MKNINRLLIGFLVLFIIGAIYLTQSAGFNIKLQKKRLVSFVKKQENIKNIEELAQLREIFKKEKYSYYLISFFSRICMTCPSGIMIEKLNDLYKSYKHLYILAVLSKDFSNEDIENLKVNLGVGFQVERASEKLSENWNKWTNESEKTRFAYSAFLTDKKGNVIEVLNPRNEKKFFEFIQDQINKKENNDKRT